MNLHCEPGEQGIGLLRIEGEIRVEHAEELRQALLEGLEQYQHLQVDCEQVGTLDFFAVQLLCSAHRTSVARQKILTFSGTPSEPVRQAISATGFARHRGCSLCPKDVRCLWL